MEDFENLSNKYRKPHGQKPACLDCQGHGVVLVRESEEVIPFGSWIVNENPTWQQCFCSSVIPEPIAVLPRIQAKS
jgi:hypothetical protein